MNQLCNVSVLQILQKREGFDNRPGEDVMFGVIMLQKCPSRPNQKLTKLLVHYSNTKIFTG